MPTDLDKLQGAWKITALEIDGQAVPASKFNDSRITVNGDKFISTGMAFEYEGTIQLDPASKPKAFDLTFTAGHAKGIRHLGIYRIRAEEWTLCLAMRGDVRPTKFATAPDTGIALETFRRDPDARKPAQPKSASVAQASSNAPVNDAVSAPPTALEGEWEMLSAVMDGAPLNQEMVKWCRRITRGDITRVVAGPQEFVNAKFTLDDTRKPGAIDYLNLTGAAQGKAQAGIFELSESELKICVAPPGKPRPSEFSSKPGDGRSFTTWRRLKK